ncbi:amino acid adenylation domain-containing protein, partial [Gordonia sp. BP-119]|nr:amino acid adenylation domain-containing protein [Gordonia sp. BP-119]
GQVEVDALTAVLATRLPEYMVPAMFVSLEALPLNASGKLDRKALPAPDIAERTQTYRAPSTAAETVLARIVADLLGIEQVGVDDSFFALGGDSIMSIQLVSRAKREGMVLRPADVFEQKTIAALARIAEVGAAATVLEELPGGAVGQLPLTPIMHWMIEDLRRYDEFAQSVLVTVPAGVTEAGLRSAAQILLDHHDMLRSRLVRSDNGAHLEVAPAGEVSAEDLLTRVGTDALPGTDSFAALAQEHLRRAAADLDVERGVTIRFVWFDLPGDVPGRLLVVAHHLVVDGVSWRALLPDLALAWYRVADGATVELSSKGTSFRRWATGLADAAAGRFAELPLWQGILADPDPILGSRAFDPELDTVSTVADLRVELEGPVVESVLGRLPAVVHGSVNDGLLAALALAVARWRRDRRSDADFVLVTLEGHGREEQAVPGADLANTVGWFTTSFPVRLELDAVDIDDAFAGGRAAGSAIKRVKEQLLAIPDHGIGYGMLRYLAEDSAAALRGLATPQIGFNYLGRVNTTGDQTADWMPDTSVAGLGGARDEDMSAPTILDINASAVDTAAGTRLGATFSYATGVLTGEQAREIADLWVEALTALATYADTPGAGGRTPSDLPLVAIDQAGVEHLEARYPDLTDVWSLSPLQEGLLFHAQFAGEHLDAYMVQTVLDLEGAVDAQRLRAAGQALLRRHANLRVAFDTVSGEPVQVVPADVELPFDEIDLSGADDIEAAYDQLLAADRARGFDMATPPLVRFTLVDLGGGRYRMLSTNHHVLLDGWSTPLLLKDLLYLYATRGDASALPAPGEYRDFLAWLATRDREASLAAWRNAFAGLDEPSLLAAGEGDGSVASADTSRCASAGLTADLSGLARDLGVTMNTLVQAAWGVVMSALTSHRDVVFGTTVSGRPADLSDVETMIGLFINTLPVRVTVDPGLTLTELITRIQSEQAALLDHHHLGLAEIQRSIGAAASFDTLTVFESYPVDQAALAQAADIDGMRVTGLRGMDSTHYPVTLVASIGDRLHLQMKYLTGVYGADEVDALLGRVLRVLTAFVENPGQRIAAVDVLDAAERDMVLTGWIDPGVEVPSATLAAVFAERAGHNADRTAVVAGGERLTYGQLADRVNRLARILIDEGVGPESMVAVAMPRTADLVVALLAVVTAGGAYVPVDVTYPQDRLAYMLADSEPVVVLTTGEDAQALPDNNIRAVLLDSRETVERLAQVSGEPVTDSERTGGLSPQHPAYVIYTSGSTGRPKGVVVPHADVLTLMVNTQTKFGFDETDVWTMFHSYAFDFSVWELWGPLLHGGSLVVVDFVTSRSPEDFLALLRRERVTVLNQTPSAFYQLAEADRVAGEESVSISSNGSGPSALSLRYVIFGGEALDLGQLDRWYTRHAEDSPRLVNMYGITETTVHVSYLPLDREFARESTASVIGRGLPGVGVYVLDSRLRPTPVGVEGEMYVHGGQLARGYLGRPDLTAGRFVADPFGAAGHRMYRTGDLARWNAAGQLEYLGRTDFQVQLRGFRIELGEVESALLRYSGVAASSVQVRSHESLGDHLVGYVVPEAGTEIEVDSLLAFVGGFLASYMVPSAIVVLDEFPLTANGKLDRRALPSPDFVSNAVEFVAPRTLTEEIVAGVFAEVLGVDRVGVTASFFDLGGNSLSATKVAARVGAALGVKVGVRELFDAPSVEMLAARIEGMSAADGPALVAQPRPERIPLSLAQRRMWFLNQFDTDSAAYNIPLAVRLSGELDLAALERAVSDVVTRHEVLRTVFPDSVDGPHQVIVGVDEVVGELPPVELAEAAVATVLRDFVLAPFDVAQSVPLRVALYRLSAQEHILAFVVHHICGDGVSTGPLARDVMMAYLARSGGEEPGWEPLPVQYADYTLWQRQVLGEESDPASVAARQAEYWTRTLAGLPEVLALPTDRPRPARRSQAGAIVSVDLDETVYRGLRDLAAGRGATLFMVMHSALATLLARLSGTSDIAIGTPIAGRGEPELDALIGMFVNTLVLRTEVESATSFDALLEQAREVDLNAFAHADLPFERIVDLLQPARSTSHSPLFQVVLSSAEVGQERFELPGLTVSGIGDDIHIEKFDLEVYYEERVDEAGHGVGMSLTFGYATDIFDAQTVVSIASRMVTLLGAVVADPAGPIGDIDLLEEPERAALVPVRGRPAARPRTLVDLFDSAARRDPSATALVFGAVQLTYAELDDRSNRLARLLIQRGVGAGSAVVLGLSRSVESVVAVWAVARAGGAFVPVDPNYPADRIEHMIADSGAHLGITVAAHRGLPAGTVDWLVLDDRDVADDLATRSGAELDAAERRAPIRPADPAYVIYTSGSTGVPKGVVVTHTGVGDFADELRDRCQVHPGARVLHFASPSFDASVLEYLLAFGAAATFVVSPPEVYGGAELTGLLRENKVSHAFVTPAALASVDDADLPLLEMIAVGGDVCPPELVARWAPGRRMFNMYGPTEATISVTIDGPMEPGLPVRIGTPNQGVEALVLDSRLQPVPAGVPGELFVSGPSLARGYRNLPGQTAERFLANPYGEPGQRMYRTGDVVRWVAGGALEYLGRSDFQVKVRGFRIELGEISGVLARHDSVGFVTTEGVTGPHGGTVLVAYVLPASGHAVDEEGLRAYAAESLPGYMVPSYVVALESVPRTPAGKLDRRALPLPEFVGEVDDYVAPRSLTEEIVAGVFAEVLGVDRVGVTASFFDLGGNSLSATKVAARVGAALGVKVGVRELFDAPSVEMLAARIEGMSAADGPALVAQPRPERIPLSLAQRRMWFLNQFDTDSAAYNIPLAVRLSGELDLAALERAVSDVVTRHEVLRTV